MNGASAKITIGLDKLVEAQRIENWIRRANKGDFAPMEYGFDDVDADGFVVTCTANSFSEGNLYRQVETLRDYVKSLKGTDSFEASVSIEIDGVSWFKNEEDGE